jgi:VCBS repeat-containing protein
LQDLNFWNDETFSARRENTEWEQKWLYTTKVYNLEVEDFHTYYVGKLGAWVHNTNCYETTVEYMKKHGVLPSIDNQAFHTEGQVKAIIAAMESAGVAPSGMILMQEKVTSAVANDLFWVKYQRGVENGLFKSIDGDDFFFARTLIYKNPIENGKDFIRLGDGAASFVNGSQKVLSKTTIDSKGFQNAWSKLVKYTGQELAEAKDKLAIELVKMSAALKQNSVGIHKDKPFSHVLEFVDGADRTAVTAFIKEVTSDPKWIQKYGADWFSPNIYLAHNPFPGEVKRVLPDELIGFVKDANGQYIDQKISKGSVLKEMEQDQGFLADIKKIFGDNEPSYQLTDSTNTFELTTDRLVSSDALSAVLAQAKAFWLQHGALASVLNAVELSVEPLPSAAVAQTIGKTITLSPDAAGWGWFVDATPAESEEFTQIGSSQDYRAQSGSGADGKIDLLGVMIHELGHVLGLEHSDDAGDEMAATVTPGLRRLPDLDAGEMPYGFGAAIPLLPQITPLFIDSISRAQVIANPTLQGGNLSTLQDWATQGSVVASNAAGGAPTGATLSETGATQTRLNQVFMVGPQDRFLSFTLSNLVLDAATNGPDDAFEAALLNANTGANLLSPLALCRTDALLNLQASGAELAAIGVTHVTHPNGSRTYLVDLAGIAAGTAVNLSFDLIGFGNTAPNLGSHATVSNVRLMGMAQTRDDSISTFEDTAARIIVLANDIDANQIGIAPVIVAAPQHGLVVVNPDGTFSYTPAQDYFGTDSFTYRLSNGVVDSNVSTVSLSITPVNDAPVAADKAGPQTTLAEDSTLTIDLLAGANDAEGAPLAASIVSGPLHGSLVQGNDGTVTYTADANYFGLDSFTYRVNDGEADSSLASVSLTVTAVNDAPVASSAETDQRARFKFKNFLKQKHHLAQARQA